MAQIVAGLAHPHGPTIQTHWSRWNEFEQRDRSNPQLAAEPAVTFDELAALAARTKPTLKDELSEPVWMEKHERAHRALGTVKSILEEAHPDVIVCVGDDQHEHLLDENMPQFCVYYGDTVTQVARSRADGQNGHGSGGEAEERREHPAAPELARHVIKSLIRQGFDVATSNSLKPERGLGHAFTYLYNSGMIPEERPIPMLPVMVNTFYPPNQAPPARCYALGRALRRAIESWDADQRVAIIGSGGLSHVVVDEEVDRLTLEAIRQKDVELIEALPEERLIRGTSENRNWLVVAGAMEPCAFNLVDYVPVYRSSAAMGHGLAFGYWT
jgi:3-O-methylgallate 3,4-dioxygenase